MAIRIEKGKYQPKIQIIGYKSAAIRQGIVALLYSTYLSLFQDCSTIDFIELHGDISIGKWIVPFFIKKISELFIHSGRSPPYQFENL